ncbi:hypothetical protein BASA60_000551 [Batrachochytrium salamandrivorans]|nr:hypothetical protein BASA60_000551 [Batrachochytrium salamandrivorans]
MRNISCAVVVVDADVAVAAVAGAARKASFIHSNAATPLQPTFIYLFIHMSHQHQQYPQYSDDYQQQQNDYDYSYDQKYGYSGNSNPQQPAQPYSQSNPAGGGGGPGPAGYYNNQYAAYERQADSLYGDPFAAPAQYNNTGVPYGDYQQQEPGLYHAGDAPAAYTSAPQQSFVAPAMMAEAITMPRGAYSTAPDGGGGGNPAMMMNSSHQYDGSHAGYNNQMYDPSHMAHRNPDPHLHPSDLARYDSQKTFMNGSPDYKPGQSPAGGTRSGKGGSDSRGAVGPEPELSNSFDLGSKKRRYGFCFHTRRGMYIVGGITAGLVVLAAILGFFLFPRFPSLKVLDIQVIPDSNQLSSNPDGVGLIVKLAMAMNVSVVNPNRYHLKIETIDLSAMLQPNVTQLSGISLGTGAAPLAPVAGQGVQIGSGQHPTPIIFPPKQNTTFILNFNLSYVTTDLLEDADAKIAFLRLFGFTPAFEDDIRINCPLIIARTLSGFNLTTFGLNVVPPSLNPNPAGAAGAGAAGAGAAGAGAGAAGAGAAGGAAAPRTANAVSRSIALRSSSNLLSFIL